MSRFKNVLLILVIFCLVLGRILSMTWSITENPDSSHWMYTAGRALTGYPALFWGIFMLVAPRSAMYWFHDTFLSSLADRIERKTRMWELRLAGALIALPIGIGEFLNLKRILCRNLFICR